MTGPLLTIDYPGGRFGLGPGEAFTFGRVDAVPGTGIVPVPSGVPHLGLAANPRLHHHAGRVDVDATGWVLANVGRWLQLRVVELGGPNRIDLDPGRVVRVPYPQCNVEVATGDETVGFTATCPVLPLPAASPAAGSAPLSGATVGGLGLDRDAGYFRAAVALCAPRLRDPQSDEVAPVGEIVRLLNLSGAEPERVTAKAVERRLAHLRGKLNIGAADPYGGSAAGLEVRDAARQLADLLLRTGTVTAADLALLDPSAVPPPPAGPVTAGAPSAAGTPGAAGPSSPAGPAVRDPATPLPPVGPPSTPSWPGDPPQPPPPPPRVGPPPPAPGPPPGPPAGATMSPPPAAPVPSPAPPAEGSAPPSPSLATDVLLAFDSVSLDAGAAARIDELAGEVAAEAAGGTVTIVGHTDDAYNQTLSEQRAEAVRAALEPAVGRGDLAYEVSGAGETDPVAPNAVNGAPNPDGQARNRRVTIAYEAESAG